MARAARLIFSQKGDKGGARVGATPWPILVVDDDSQVHDMTRVLLRDYSYEGRDFEVLSAFSAAEAAELLGGRSDIPVVLLDVVMETGDAGLQLVRRIRGDIGNRDIRIILRTGQPGEAPERDVVLAYDINDYKSKSELTAQKLFTSIVGGVRAWRDIVTIGRLNRELVELNAQLEAKVQKRTAELEARTAELGRARDRAEMALERETEARGQLRQFLGMVSHEFRTPLAIIDSAAQMLTMRAERADTGMLPRLKTIREAVGRLIDLITTCLADEQLESGRIVMQEQAFELAPILLAAVDHHRAASPGRAIELEAEMAAPVWGDPGLIALVINNLLANALKYSTEGAVRISATPEHSGVSVSVQDSGIGIPADDVPKIFDRFFRASNTQTMPGSGIGLHMVRQIMDLHGGTLSVDSRLGEGSTFTIWLRMPPRGKGAGGSRGMDDIGVDPR
ncbi:Sensor histidine kinase/response regulator [Magnetospirillum sp. LM-5]|uniref:hybrid sensor histidine kinase/response regulator n=1 Tax=Magnetospirillum sp. LM-5 TaxID=2681466 RepID=UPI00137D6C81|nr:hybrid sensor histidine kinase/response regulator [Magnetospirillum sp. LM-5]CAA7621544.1 Sensor histidine kinase/response regulator [Magnetospirillum sp. LM-5]